MCPGRAEKAGSKEALSAQVRRARRGETGKLAYSYKRGGKINQSQRRDKDSRFAELQHTAVLFLGEDLTPEQERVGNQLHGYMSPLLQEACCARVHRALTPVAAQNSWRQRGGPLRSNGRACQERS